MTTPISLPLLKVCSPVSTARVKYLKDNLTDTELLKQVDALGPIANVYGLSIAQLSLAWILQNPGIFFSYHRSNRRLRVIRLLHGCPNRKSRTQRWHVGGNGRKQLVKFLNVRCQTFQIQRQSVKHQPALKT